MRKHAMSATIVALATVCAIGASTGTGSLLFGDRDAHAIIGRPLTPMSYAGVARRTTRRAVYSGGVYGRPYAGGVYSAPYAAATPAGVVTALPATGCARVNVSGTVVYQCGAARYTPYYEGPTLVYKQL